MELTTLQRERTVPEKIVRKKANYITTAFDIVVGYADKIKVENSIDYVCYSSNEMPKVCIIYIRREMTTIRFNPREFAEFAGGFGYPVTLVQTDGVTAMKLGPIPAKQFKALMKEFTEAKGGLNEV